MNIKYKSFNKINIFLNNLYINIDNYEDRKEIEEKLKKYILKINKKLKLIGFYKINVYPCKNIGLFIDIIKLEDYSYSLIFNYKINIKYLNVYFKTDDFFIIKDFENIYFYDNNYYFLVKNIIYINKFIEFGSFVYGDDMFNIYNKLLKIK